ncbi:hypothetical protein JCM17960_07880 [Magnetospira thiophila]
MSNVHHLRNAALGAGRWNAWRKSEPGVQPDLSQADLRGANLSGMDLAEAVMSLANLKKANLSGANLKSSNLAGAILEDVNLAGCVMVGSNLSGARLTRTNLAGADMRRVNLSGARFGGEAILTGTDLGSANLAGAKLGGSILSGANLARANLAGADLRNTDLSGANLSGAVTAGARFDGADLSGTILDDFGEFDESAFEEDYAAEGGDGYDDNSFMSEDFDQELPEDDLSEPEFFEPEPEPEPEPEMQAPPVEVEPEENPNAFYGYETGEWAVFSLCIKHFAQRTLEEKRNLVSLLKRYNKFVVGENADVCVTTRGDAIIGVFHEPVQALLFASNYINVLKNIQVEAFAAIHWGTATTRTDPSTGETELVGDSISPAARLEPLGSPGEILVLEELHSRVDEESDMFSFNKVVRKWKRAGDADENAVDAVCYQVLTAQ